MVDMSLGKKQYYPRETLYLDDRVLIRGKVHWSDEDWVLVGQWILKDVIESDEVLPPHVWSHLVKARNNYTCVKCGFEANEMRSVCASHINYIRNHQELGKFTMSNGETLCWPCHSKYHHWRSGKERPQGEMTDDDRKNILEIF